MSEIGTFLGNVPAADWERLTALYSQLSVDEGIDKGLDQVAPEMGILWKTLKHQLSDAQLDKCYAKLLGVVIKGDVLTQLREAFETIQVTARQAEQSRELLIRAATTSGLPEDFYIERWQDEVALCKDLLDRWKRRFSVDILEMYRQEHGAAELAGESDPAREIRRQMSRRMVSAVPIAECDDMLAEILTRLAGGALIDNRNKLRRERRGV